MNMETSVDLPPDPKASPEPMNCRRMHSSYPPGCQLYAIVFQKFGAAVCTDTPYWLLWSTGIVAFVLSIVAFVLWGINGASTLFDMIVALCT
jgi:hypothetical protein